MSDQRLPPNPRVPPAARHYIQRLRRTFGGAYLGCDAGIAADFEKHVGEMQSILEQKNVSPVDANRVIQEVLDAAVDHQLAGLRREDNRRAYDESVEIAHSLILRLRTLSAVVSSLPPRSRGVLNRRYGGVFTPAAFDRNMLIEVIYAIDETLIGLSPKRISDEARNLINPPARSASNHSKLGDQCPLIDLWNNQSAATHFEVERHIRTNKRKVSFAKWLVALAKLIEASIPKLRRGRPTSLKRVFVNRAARTGRRIGLRPGRFYDGIEEKHIDSSFQRFCNAALAAVGDASRISDRQVDRLSADVRPRRSKTAISD